MKALNSLMLAATLAFCAAWGAAPAYAETLVIRLGHQTGDSTLGVPQQGLRKNTVLEQYGEPGVRHPAVGQPPITRWDYVDFSVYFEYDRVIDSVRHHRAASTSTR